jgi:hypothetical protein
VDAALLARAICKEIALVPTEEKMLKGLGTIVIATLIATHASAQVQGVDLNGRYQCVLLCSGAPGSPAFITQNGWELNILNDVGEPSRAWVNYPGRIWVDRANQGAIYSPDGMRIQFDRGTIWQRALELPPPALRRR